MIDRSFPAAGRWIRRGGSIVLLPGGSPADGEMQGEVTATAGASGVIDPRIDVAAQQALMRMAKAGPAALADATGLLNAVKGGVLAGIYQVDQAVPALRAKAMGKGWWQLIPKGKGAALVPDPAGGAPLIAFEKWLAGSVEPLACVLRAGFEKLEHAFVRPPARRLRISVWAPAQVVTRERLEPMRGFVDDVSLGRTLQVGSGPGPLNLVLDSDSHPGRPYPELVAECHLQGIQVLAGFSIVPENVPGKTPVHKLSEPEIGRRFNAWLRTAGDEEMAAFARRIRSFLLSCSLNPAAPALEARRRFDGISFDVESLAPDSAPGFTRFVQKVAEVLEPSSLWVAVAVPPLEGEIQGGLAGFAYSGARCHRNLVIRPMAYGVPRSGTFLAAWHQRVIDYALGSNFLPPSRLQLGLSTGPVNGGRVSPDEVIQRCRGMLRRSGAGLVIWFLEEGDRAGVPDMARPVARGAARPSRGDRWRDYDQALNGDARAPLAGRVGHPLQAPLDAAAQTRIVPREAPITRPAFPRPAPAGPARPRIPVPTIPAPRPWSAMAPSSSGSARRL